MLGLVGMVVGADVLLFWSQPPLDRRFSVYAPLTGAYFVPSFVTPGFVAGLIILIAGAALVAGWVGFRIGWNRHPGPGDAATDPV